MTSYARSSVGRLACSAATAPQPDSHEPSDGGACGRFQNLLAVTVVAVRTAGTVTAEGMTPRALCSSPECCHLCNFLASPSFATLVAQAAAQQNYRSAPSATRDQLVSTYSRRPPLGTAAFSCSEPTWQAPGAKPSAMPPAGFAFHGPRELLAGSQPRQLQLRPVANPYPGEIRFQLARFVGPAARSVELGQPVSRPAVGRRPLERRLELLLCLELTGNEEPCRRCFALVLTANGQDREEVRPGMEAMIGQLARLSPAPCCAKARIGLYAPLFMFDGSCRLDHDERRTALSRAARRALPQRSRRRSISLSLLARLTEVERLSGRQHVDPLGGAAVATHRGRPSTDSGCGRTLRASASRLRPCSAGCSRRKIPTSGGWSRPIGSSPMPCARGTATRAMCRATPVA